MSDDVSSKNEGPIRLSRRFVAAIQALGVISITYQLSKDRKSLAAALPYLHFSTGTRFSRKRLTAAHAKGLQRCRDHIVRHGKPIILSEYLDIFRAAEPRLTEEIWTGSNQIGLRDHYMIPVYGPFRINGVISFGFAEKIHPGRKDALRQLESLAVAHHNQLVRHFGEKRTDIDLSKRENDVLTWIARGKSSTDIATILGISKSTVDTYTRRIFEKMGVNDRVSAAVNGVVEGLIQLDGDD